MGKIHLLDQDTINQIAAGEVVDRPVSVVKELTENAIDAGATAVTVEIKQGGTTLIRVTDNGSGIVKEDLSTAFKRHSTSKITQAADLLTVSSLGFRGEALSSIAAIARVELITRTHTSLIGNRYVIEGGKELALEEVGAPEGTTILVRDLFFNTPARRKFLKTPATEGGYIFDMICKMAMSRPDVSFRFIQNGQNRLHTAGNHNLKDVIYQIYGRDTVKALLPISFKSSFFDIEGFIGKPLLCKSSRSYETYFINGRYIRSNLINKAIEEGYRSFLMQHKFPFTVFNIRIEPEFTDVNVHPSKMELRFRNQDFLYEEMIAAVRKTLTLGELSPDFSVETEAQKKAASLKSVKAEEVSFVLPDSEPKKEVEQMRKPAPCAAGKTAVSRTDGSGAPANKTGESGIPVSRTDGSGLSVSKAGEGKTPVGNSCEYKADGTEAVKWEEVEVSLPEVKVPKSERKPVQKTSIPEPFEVKREARMVKEKQELYQMPVTDVKQQNLFEEKLLTMDTLSQIKLAGQIFDTYWIVQYQDTFLIIDQHAAHEKVLYEQIIKKLKEQKYTIQQMSPPAIITLTPKQQGVMAEASRMLGEIGFEIEPFGGNDYAVYGMPDNLVGISPMDFLEELLENAAESGKIMPEAVYEKAASMACKAAIKGNQRLSQIEAEHLIADLVNLENPYTCPHGRPTMIKMTRYELEKKFKRIL